MQPYNPPRAATTPRSTPQGQWLYEERIRRGLRQSDLAASLGVNGGRVSEWEQGIRPIPVEVLAEILSLFAKE